MNLSHILPGMYALVLENEKQTNKRNIGPYLGSFL